MHRWLVRFNYDFVLFIVHLTRLRLRLKLRQYIRLAWRRMEIVLCGRGWTIYLFNTMDVVSTLVSLDLSLLDYCHALLRQTNCLLTATQVLDISSAVGGLLALLLQTSVVIILFRNRILLGLLLKATTMTACRLHSVWRAWLCCYQRYFVVSTRTRGFPGVLAAIESIERGVTGCVTIASPQVFLTAPSVLFGWRMSQTGHLHWLQLGQRVLVVPITLTNLHKLRLLNGRTTGLLQLVRAAFYSVPVFKKFLTLTLLTESLKLSLLVNDVSLIVPIRINRVDICLLGRDAVDHCLVSRRPKCIWGVMKIWPWTELNVCLIRLNLVLNRVSRASRTLLILVQSWKNLRIILLFAVGEHNRLASRIFSRRNSWSSCWYMIFKDTAHRVLALIQLKRGHLRLVRSSWWHKSLSWVLRTHIIVLKSVPALAICTLRSVFITLGEILLLIRCGNAIVCKL